MPCGNSPHLIDAIGSFLADDGWPISSNIALAMLTSLFPFLIFVTALAGFFGSQDLSDEAAQSDFRRLAEEVAGPIANEVHNVLTAPRGGLLRSARCSRCFFPPARWRRCGGLDRAYDFVETRPWWPLRLQSIAFMAFASFALLALAFRLVLGPLIWSNVIKFAPVLDPLNTLVTFTRLAIATIALAVTLLLAHLWLPAKRLRLIDVAPGVIMTFVCSVGFGEPSASLQ